MDAIERAQTFLETQGRPVDAAWLRHIAAGGPREAVLDALSAYQNEDGGFGRGLEVDIQAPDSQPFAARLAMHVLISVGATPDEPIVRRLTEWLEHEQDEDGCWRLPAALHDHELAPWFAGWTFPSLNPALCLAGLATRLGIGSERLHERVRRLVDRMATVEEVDGGEFYAVLPYAEYFPWVDHPRADAYVAALAARIERDARSGAYADASHFFEHAGPPEGAVVRRLPREVVEGQLARLRTEQQEDGGWPTPYNTAWRAWATAGNAVTLYAYGRR